MGSAVEALFKHWLGCIFSIKEYIGPCIYIGHDYYDVNVALLGRSPRGFVLALWGDPCGERLENLNGLVARERVVGSCKVPSGDGFVEMPRYEVKGFVLAKPVLKYRALVFQLVERYEGPFRRICIPPLEGIRWWMHNLVSGPWITPELNYPEGEHVTVVLKDNGVVQTPEGDEKLTDIIYSPCKYVFGGRWLYWSPVGPPVRAPGAGSLTGAELPVVRSPSRYLRVGPWIAWHRVLGILDDGKWVVIGDDGLYEAVFTPTAKDPLGEFGEVGYVKVTGPYTGDVDDVRSPCGAPGLVACVDDTREALTSAGHRCDIDGGIPHVLLGYSTVYGLGREVIDWPLVDTCGVLLKLGDFWIFDWRS
ncbi:MAG: hypothetical protein QW680_09170 [Pyrobaculum sp.]|uniref:hypothetical protein n=1 Tax=Pyrobaculum sp. TaxID=2004705 RepID=UPI003166BF30